MTLNYFKDHLFDLINESESLDIVDIISDDLNNTFRIILADGAEFIIKCYDANTK